MAKACICGRVGCAVHRRGPHGSSAAYGADHQERRLRMLRSTPEICARCGGGPRAGDPWEAGHVVDLARGGGPDVVREHRSCNRAAGARLKAQRAKEAADARAARRIAQTLELIRG